MFFHHFFHHRKDTGLIGKGCKCSHKKYGVKGHLGVIWGHWTLIFKICIIGYCINIQLYKACKCIEFIRLDWSKKYQNFLSTCKCIWHLSSVKNGWKCIFVSSFYPLKRALLGLQNGSLPPRPPPGALKWAPGPHAVRRDAPVVIGTITFAISKYFRFFFFFFFFFFTVSHSHAWYMYANCIDISLIMISPLSI